MIKSAESYMTWYSEGSSKCQTKNDHRGQTIKHQLSEAAFIQHYIYIFNCVLDIDQIAGFIIKCDCYLTIQVKSYKFTKLFKCDSDDIKCIQ